MVETRAGNIRSDVGGRKKGKIRNMDVGSRAHGLAMHEIACRYAMAYTLVGGRNKDSYSLVARSAL